MKVNPFRNFLKYSLRTFLVLVSFIIIYFIAAFSFSYIPVNRDFVQCPKDGVEIFLLSNGVHTDIVIPIRNDLKDWSSAVDPANTKSGNTTVNYAAFGWGDKGFYLETPTWGDLTTKTAVKALFYLGSSAMHVTFYQNMKENGACKKICISKESYQKIIHFIDNSFDKDSAGNFIQIPAASYAGNDAFYEAKGAYSLFYTCNTWTNCGLKSGKLKACLWTPFDIGIFHQYEGL